jgi:hypothetical protein
LSVAATCSGTLNRDCYAKSFGPLDYFDKLVTIQYWRVDGGPVPYPFDYSQEFIGECSPGVFHRIMINGITINQLTISQTKAYNSTSNYFFMKSQFRNTGYHTNY